MCLRLEAIDKIGIVKEIFLEVYDMIANKTKYGHYHLKALFAGKSESLADSLREKIKVDMQLYVPFSLRIYESKQAVCSPPFMFFVRIVMIYYSIKCIPDNFNLVTDHTI